jgi:hypothetical protein
MSPVAQEKKWKAEADARSLKEALMIRADKARMQAAMKIVNQEAKALAALKKDDGGFGVKISL